MIPLRTHIIVIKEKMIKYKDVHEKVYIKHGFPKQKSVLLLFLQSISTSKKFEFDQEYIRRDHVTKCAIFNSI